MGKPDTLAKEQALISRLLSREVEGLIVNPVQPDAVVAEALAGVRPRLVPGIDGDVFLPDDYTGLSDALEQLMRLGHRRIGMVYGYSWQSHAVRNRFRAYRDAIARRGIEPDPALLRNGGYTLDGGADATRKLLSLPEPPTAIIYWSDLMAIAGMDAAREIGISVPADISVVGFDDLAVSARVHPRLSSIRQEKYETGVAMAQRVIDRIEGRLADPCGQVISPTVFVMRESVGEARAIGARRPALFRAQQIPLVAVEVLENRNGAVVFFARLFQKCHAARAHALIVPPEVISAKEKEHPARGLVPDEARLFFGRRPGEQKRGAGSAGRRNKDPPLVRPHGCVLEKGETQFFREVCDCFLVLFHEKRDVCDHLPIRPPSPHHGPSCPVYFFAPRLTRFANSLYAPGTPAGS